MSAHGRALAFKGDVDRALIQVARLLEQERRPVYPSGVAHRFDDKYLLVQVVINAAIAAQLNALELFLGVDRATLDTLQGWGQRRAVTLRFEWERNCAFSRKATREVEGPTRTVKRSIFGGTTVKKSKRYIRVARVARVEHAAVGAAVGSEGARVHPAGVKVAARAPYNNTVGLRAARVRGQDGTL